MKLNILDTIALVLVVIGGLNWGLIGLGIGNVVTLILGEGALASIVYVLVGLAAVYLVVIAMKLEKK